VDGRAFEKSRRLARGRDGCAAHAVQANRSEVVFLALATVAGAIRTVLKTAGVAVTFGAGFAGVIAFDGVFAVGFATGTG